jgi:septation ring formation regulator EzrA
MAIDEFKTTGIVALITLVMSMISLPILIKKRTRLVRIMNARKRHIVDRGTADEFEEFFD